MSALQHLLFPSVFEPIVSAYVKEKIIKAFAGSRAFPGRATSTGRWGTLRCSDPRSWRRLSLLQPPVEPVWCGGRRAPRGSSPLARRSREVDDFDEQEVDDKLEVARRLAEAREASALRRRLAPCLKAFVRFAEQPHQLASTRHVPERGVRRRLRPYARSRHLWSGEGSDIDREAFLAAVPEHAIGTPARGRTSSVRSWCARSPLACHFQADRRRNDLTLSRSSLRTGRTYLAGYVASRTSSTGFASG